MRITIREDVGVVVVEDHDSGTWGMAVCGPEDEFNLRTGIALAKMRMVPCEDFSIGRALHKPKIECIKQSELNSCYIAGRHVLQALRKERPGEGVAVHPAPTFLGIDTGASSLVVESLRPLVQQAADFLTQEIREKARAATPPVESSAPVAPSSQSHVTLPAGEYLRLLALEKRVEAARGSEPVDTRHPRGK